MRHRLLGPILGAVLVAAIGLVPLGVATAFAHPAFQAQWQQGEGVASNFWGPLTTAHGGQQEPYAESPVGQRLVQYFDKGRMDLANSAIGTVSSGLLATDLTKGQIQVGDAAFQAKPRPPSRSRAIRTTPAPPTRASPGRAHRSSPRRPRSRELS